jgi:short-subunit dehydrogenase
MADRPKFALDPKTAKDKYGPWAVIAGGSDGTGEAYARELAAVGINVMLVARRAEVLEALAADLRAKNGVETRILVQDLMDPNAAKNMLKAASDIEVGCYVSNAGVDGTGSKFFKHPVERWLRMGQMNVQNLTEAVHGFGSLMIERGRGGIVIMASGAGLVGTPFLAMYSGTKGFELLLAESLWGELEDTNVDIVGVIAPSMTTPFFMKNIAGEGFKLGSDICSPEQVAHDGLAALGKRPVIIFQSPRRPPPEQFLAARLNDLQKTLESGKSYLPKSEQAPS